MKKGPSRKSARRFRTFTGKTPENVEASSKKSPKEWVRIAKVLNLAYNSSKLNGGGDGTMQGFIHRFGAKIHLYTDPDGKYLLIAGPGLKVTRRGIVG